MKTVVQCVLEKEFPGIKAFSLSHTHINTHFSVRHRWPLSFLLITLCWSCRERSSIFTISFLIDMHPRFRTIVLLISMRLHHSILYFFYRLYAVCFHFSSSRLFFFVLLLFSHSISYASTIHIHLIFNLLLFIIFIFRFPPMLHNSIFSFF